MKKLVLLGCALVLLTGCGSKVKCTGEVYGQKAEVTGEFKKNDLKEMTMTYKFEDKDVAEKACSSFKKDKDSNVKCSSKSVTVSQKKPKSDKSKTTKDEFIKEMEKDGLSCK